MLLHLKHALPLGFALLSSVAALQAQQLPCGTHHHADQLVKERMLRQRDLGIYAPQNRTISYVPVSFHLVGTDEGEHYPSEVGVLQALCLLNEKFADQDIQFYIHNQLLYMPNTEVFDDGYGWGASGEMENAKIPNTLNIFVGANVSQPVAGYYSPWGDYVFVRHGEMNNGSTTLTHELGHFFSLPHTFYGWEDTDCEGLYGGGPVPQVVNGDAVEYVARSGGNTNCQFAADGFCDTEADYYSYRQNCPIGVNVYDPDNVRLDPDETLYMSYLSDACMNRFSDDQEAAIFADLSQRGWANDPLPAGILPLPDSVEWTPSPAHNSLITIDGALELKWNSVPGATRYYVEVYRTFFGSPIETIERVSLSSVDTTLTIPVSKFIENRIYAWRVTAYNRYYSCLPSSDYFQFVPNALLNTSVNNIESQSEWNLSVHPNPVQQSGYMLVQSPANTSAAIRLYSIDGKLQWQIPNMEINIGENRIDFQSAGLPQGLYILEMDCPEQKMHQRISVYAN